MSVAVNSSTSANTLLDAAESLAVGDKKLYDRALRRIESNGEEEANIAKVVLTWLAFAEEGLSAKDIQRALALESASHAEDGVLPLDLIISACAGLVEICETENAGGSAVSAEVSRAEIRFIHRAVREYIHTTKSLWIPHPHHTLARACVICLSQHTSDLQRQAGKARSRSQLEALLQEIPLLRYAYRNWARHAGVEAGSGRLQPHLFAFLSLCNRYPEFPAGPDGGLYQMTGLHLAALYGLLDAISSKALRCDPCEDDEGDEGFTPFHCAAMSDQVEALDALIRHYGSTLLEQSQAIWKVNLLQTAVVHSATSVVRALTTPSPLSPLTEFLQRHPEQDSINDKDEVGETALMFACRQRDMEITSLLLAHSRVDVNIRDNQGKTALIHAYCTENDMEADIAIARALLSRSDVEVNAKDHEGKTPLMHSVTYLGSLDGIRLLLNHPEIDLNARDNRGWTALMHAVDRCPGYIFDDAFDNTLCLLDDPKVTWVAEGGAKNTRRDDLFLACREGDLASLRRMMGLEVEELRQRGAHVISHHSNSGHEGERNVYVERTSRNRSSANEFRYPRVRRSN